MFNTENDDFLGGVVHRVIDEIGITPRDEFTDAFGFLNPADIRKKDDGLQALVDRSADALGCRRVPSPDVIGNRGDILQRARCKPQLH
jgi:hypothetical protein